MAGDPIGDTGRRFPGAFDPAGGGLLGLIGAIQGFPTRQEAFALQQQHELGQVRQEAMSGLAQEISRAQGNVSRGLINFFQTDVGQRVFTDDPTFLQDAQKLLSFAQQPAEVRERQMLAEQAQQGGLVGQIAQSDIATRFADAQIKLQQARQGGGTQRERAVAKLVSNGDIDELFGTKLLAGVIQSEPIRNEFGDITGYNVVDLAAAPGERQVRRMSPGAGETAVDVRRALGNQVEAGTEAAQQAAQAGVPGASQQDMEARERTGMEQPSADIIRGGGAVPIVERMLGGFVGQVNPSFSATEVQAQQDALNLIQADAEAILRSFGGRMSEESLKPLRRVTQNVSYGKNPRQVATSLLSYRSFLERRRNTLHRFIGRENIAQKTRENASNDLLLIETALANVPSEASLKDKRAQIKTEDPIQRAIRTAEEAEGAVRGAAGQTPSGPMPDTGAVRPGQPSPAGAQPMGGGQQAQQPGMLDQATGAVRGALGMQPGEDFFRRDPQEAFGPRSGPRIPIIDQIRNLPALRAQAIDAISTLEQTVPDPVREPIMNIASGFNAALAMTTGAAANDLDAALRFLGTEGFLDAPGNGPQELKNALQRQGVDVADQVDSLSERIGQQTFNAGLTAAVTLAAAPTLAAQAGSPTAQWLANEFRKFAAQRPAMFAATEFGAVGGIEVGRDVMRESIQNVENPALRESLNATSDLMWGWLGATLVGGPFAPTRKLMKEITESTEFMRGAERDITGQLNLTPLRTFAEDAIESDRQRVNNTITAVVNRFARRALPGGARDAEVNPEKQVAELSRRLKGAERASRKMESRKWRAVDKKRAMPKERVREIVRFVNQKFSQTSDIKAVQSDRMPMDVVRQIRGWKTGKNQYRSLTINDLIQLRGTLLRRVREGRGTEAQQGFMKRLGTKLLDEVERAFPNETALAEARAFSQWHADRFHSEALEPFITTGATFDPQRTMQNLMSNVVGRTRPGDTVRQGAGASSLLSDVDAGLDQNRLRQQGERVIRNYFGQIAREANQVGTVGARDTVTPGQRAAAGRTRAAQKGDEFMNREQVRRFMREFPDFFAEGMQVSAGLRRALDEQAEVARSAFSKFANVEPQQAVANIMRSSDKVDQIKQLTNRIRQAEDDAALHALRNGMIEWVFRGRDPQSVSVDFFRNRLADPGIRQSFEVAFGDEGMKRLNRMLTAATKMERGEGRLGNRLLESGARITARVTGAGLGRMLGTGTIQAPGILSNAAGTIVDTMFRPFNPSRLFAAALLDPKFERILLARNPDTLKDVAKFLDQMRAVQTGIAASARIPGALPATAESDGE